MMKKLLSPFKKTTRSQKPLKDFYKEWTQTLKTTLLPLLSHSLTSPSPDPEILSTHIDLIHTHFRSYFSALDLASNSDIPSLLFPDFRNPIEIPFLWFGDFHPYIFTHLLRSFLDDEDSDVDDDRMGIELMGMSSNVVLAWKNLDFSLGHFVEQLECTMRLMVPSIMARSRDSQACLVDKLGSGFAKEGGLFKVDDHVNEVVDELTCVFLEANRLRRSVLADILVSLNVYQSALFLQRLAQFYVGFRDSKLLSEFNKSNLSLD